MPDGEAINEFLYRNLLESGHLVDREEDGRIGDE
jgi:hypothetical protein